MVCAECGQEIYEFKYNLDEYVYKRGTKYFCDWTCMRKFDKETKEAERIVSVQWQRTRTGEWRAKGNDGTFVIRRFDKCFRAFYNSSTYNIHVKIKRKAYSLDDMKAICEDSEYWEW